MAKTFDTRLAEQNNGSSWRDCNDAGLGHRWRHGVTTGPHPVFVFWRCLRCPVSTRGLQGRRPRPFLKER